MGSIWIREFAAGLDSRRLPETTTGGALIRATNCHITRGGEIEKRAAMVATYSVPDTVGLAQTPSGVVVFGHQASVTVPAGVTYQRLAHPDGVTALSRVRSTDLYSSKIYAVAEFADGSRYHFYEGVRVPDWFDGRARAVFTVAGGGAGGSVTSITVGGVDIIGSSVNWTTSVNATAAAIASAINATSSSPEYTAVATDNQVAIVAAATGVAANGLAVVISTSGSMILAGTTGLVMSGGVAPPAGSFTPGTFVKTYNSKMYSVSSSVVHFSGIEQPTKWTTDAVGAGAVDVGTQTAGSEELVSMAKYQTFLALFAERTIIIEFFDVDPANNRLTQVLSNTGTIAGRSVTAFGDSDVFYLDESGLRSLRARDASNAAFTSDIGTAIDPLLVADQQALTFDERAAAIGLMEPRDGRFWLILKNKVYVFSYFTGSKISAWSTYELPFVVTDSAIYKRKVYLRGDDDVIYVYGGLGSGRVYDATEAEVWLPYLHADAPAKEKTFVGVDLACRGTWEVRAAMQPTNLDASDKIATVTETTFSLNRVPMSHRATHASFRFRSKGSGEATLGTVVIHFNSTKEDDRS